MKQIDLAKMITNNSLNSTERVDILGMEFIKMTDGNYMIKGSNGYIVDEQEKLKLEKNELIIHDFESNDCQKETKEKIDEINDNIAKATGTKTRHNRTK